jgi:hypothetical protein
MLGTVQTSICCLVSQARAFQAGVLPLSCFLPCIATCADIRLYHFDSRLP